MPNQHIVVKTQDPQWFLKLAAAAVVLTILLTIGARLAKAQRSTLALTFPIALAALLAGHFATRAFLGPWGLVAALAAIFAALYLGIRYILVTRLLVSVAVALVTMVLSIAVLVVVVLAAGLN
jgi:hypothetical protein